jgi:predicted ATP-grasp superfamily ATP-dependent carboligase
VSALLIIALSGRALAHSAQRAGLNPVVIDAFGDVDTRAASGACLVIPSRFKKGALRFQSAALHAALLEVRERYGCTSAIVGAGFEGAPECLALIAQQFTLLGNSPAQIAQVKDPLQLAALFSRAGLAHPETILSAPTNAGEWLCKRVGSSGGLGVGFGVGFGVRPHAGSDPYWQRRVVGEPGSALFLANGERALLLGINHQWVSPAPHAPFRYGGAVGQQPLPAAILASLKRSLTALVQDCGLKGLDGLDFIWDGKKITALEINPRPPATFELYDPDFSQGLLWHHVRACDGKLPKSLPAFKTVRAHAVVHIAKAGRIPAEFSFSRACRDLPQLPRRAQVGEPLCTLITEGSTTSATLQSLQQELKRLGSFTVKRPAHV